MNIDKAKALVEAVGRMREAGLSHSRGCAVSGATSLRQRLTIRPMECDCGVLKRWMAVCAAHEAAIASIRLETPS